MNTLPLLHSHSNTNTKKQTTTWRQIQRKNFTKWKHLATFLKLNEHASSSLHQPNFPLNIPLRLAEKIEKGNWEDPILKQFLPTTKELEKKEGFTLEPVQDKAFYYSNATDATNSKTPSSYLNPTNSSKSLLQKYKGRALLITTGACAMHCRYCFRQNFSYESLTTPLKKELELIKNDKTIKEVILSGGDPLSLSTQTLKNIIDPICEIPHVKKIRFHTRFPIGIPERIDPSFLAFLKQISKQVWFVVHINHPKELDTDVLQALKSIQCCGIPVLNQSVLLKGVNDSYEVQHELCETLVDNGIIPYYLHQLDPIQGAHDFFVEKSQGLAIIKKLRESLPGYAIPQYVQEIPNSLSKTPLL